MYRLSDIHSQNVMNRECIITEIMHMHVIVTLTSSFILFLREISYPYSFSQFLPYRHST